MPEFIGNTVDIINVYSLSVPYGITFTEVNSELYCVFPAVQNAEGYFLSVDGGEKIYIPWAENNTSVKINLTSYLKNAGEHSVTVSAATSVGGFTESESVTVKYTFSTKLNAPITSSAVLEDGRVILSFENIAFADYYTVSINESSYLDINNTAESIIKVDITSYVKDIAGIYYISVRARSKNVEYYKDSDTVNLSYINYIKLAAPTLSATLEGDSINLSWNNVEHAQCYAVYENGALYAITKNSSLSLPFSNSDALFRVIALGYDFYLSSNAGECSLTNE